MSVTSGFFNSVNGDRRYSAEQMSSIFDGVITDGVFGNIGNVFKVTSTDGYKINVDTGKAWFNSAWVKNDSILPLVIDQAEVVLDRIDAVVIEVDHGDSVRLGSIKVIKGISSTSAQRPTLAKTESKHQYPIAYVYVKSGATSISQADITNMVGTSECPFITSVLQQTDIDYVFAQWERQWKLWYANTTHNIDLDADAVMSDMRSEFDRWFNDLQALLEGDVATNLSNQVANLQSKFDILASDGAVYSFVEDSDYNNITDSDGNPIEGRTILSGGNGNSSGSGNSVSKEEYSVIVDMNWFGSDAPYTNTASIAGILASDDPFVDIVLSDDYSKVESELEAFGYIYRIVTEANKVIFYATEKPETQLLIKMTVFR